MFVGGIKSAAEQQRAVVRVGVGPQYSVDDSRVDVPAVVPLVVLSLDDVTAPPALSQ